MLRHALLAFLLLALAPGLRAGAQDATQDTLLPAPDAPAVPVPLPPAPPPAAADVALATAAGCTPRAAYRVPGGAWVACPGGVVVRLDALEDAPGYRLRAAYRVAGEVDGFFEHGGRVWAELVRREAVALADPSAPHGTAPRLGGAQPGAAPAARPSEPASVELAAPRSALPHAESSSAMGPRLERREARRDRLAPARLPGFALEGRVMAFAGGSLGIGGQLGVRYRFEAPVSFELRLPLLAYSEDLGMGYGTVQIGWDDRIFGLAVGYGTGTVRELRNDFSGQFEGFASLATVALRLGAIDGLMVRIDTTLFFIERESRYAASEVVMQFPLREGNFIVLRGGGGGAIGHGYGFLGLRRRVFGEGEAGSVYVTPAIGGAGLFNNLEDFFGFGDADGRPRGGFAFSLGIDALL